MTTEPLDPPDPTPDPARPSKASDAAQALLLVVGYGSLLTLGLAYAVEAVIHGLALGSLVAWLGLPAGVYAAVRLYRRFRARGRGGFSAARDVLILLILPLWGLFYSHSMGQESCQVLACERENAVFRPLAEPEVFGLIALHAMTALAYAVSRRRPGALRPAAEALLAAMLVVGLLIHGVLQVHFGRWAPVGLLLAPVFLPCISPALTVLLYGSELRDRLRRRGSEALPPDAPPLVHRPTLHRALALTPALLGLYALIEALRLGRPDGAVAVFTRTCGHVLSTLPIEVTQGDCHYLCTVAARGHGWLVKPERLGRRRGVTIVVNRQLAVANAFEDLLHERWPRFGRLARAIYDRLGLPVSRLLHRPWLADLTYLAMKPAEWLFYGVLLLLDRGEPEARIDRMYR